jgi:seryl-tRNA synthetase
MLDIRFIRENANKVAEQAKQKGYDVDVQQLLGFDDKRRELQQKVDELRHRRNELASGKDQKPDPGEIEAGRRLKDELVDVEHQLASINKEYEALHSMVPNVFADDTPLGGEEGNQEIKKWGDTNERDFEIKDHQRWGEERGLIDFERGAKVAGTKFYYTKGSLVELEMALVQLGLKLAAEHGFIPFLVPHLVNSRVIEGAGFAARSAEEQQIYKVQGEDLNLIATAEIPLTGYHMDEILAEADLPKLYGGYSPSYRMEAGAYGKHSKGLFRVHQFNKLELYVYCKPEESEDWHQKMVALEEAFCQKLGIPYRVVRIAAGDLGAPAYKKFDLEYWSPADKSYRELMSCSNVTDYQARRLNIRYKKADGTTDFVHTLNGTLAAMSRLPIAIIENFQDKDGKVAVPAALQPYMHGQNVL